MGELDKGICLHPLRSMKGGSNPPDSIERGEGVLLFDTEGRHTYDASPVFG